MDFKVEGKCSRGRQRKKWVNIIEKDMDMFGLSKEDAIDREKWRQL